MAEITKTLAFINNQYKIFELKRQCLDVEFFILNYLHVLELRTKFQFPTSFVIIRYNCLSVCTLPKESGKMNENLFTEVRGYY